MPISAAKPFKGPQYSGEVILAGVTGTQISEWAVDLFCGTKPGWYKVKGPEELYQAEG
jgi:hypothetical protein